MNSKIDVGVIEYSLSHEGGSLHVLDYPGEEPAIVLMHGFPDDHRVYDKLLPLLTPRRAVTFDWLGYGRSDRSDTAGFSIQTRKAVSTRADSDRPDSSPLRNQVWPRTGRHQPAQSRAEADPPGPTYHTSRSSPMSHAPVAPDHPAMTCRPGLGGSGE